VFHYALRTFMDGPQSKKEGHYFGVKYVAIESEESGCPTQF